MAANQRTDVPGGVMVVSMLAIVVGIAQLVGGVVLIVVSGDVSGYATGNVVAFGIVTLLVGAVYLWIGRGLLRLDQTAWMVGLFVSGLRATYDLVWLILFGLDGVGVTTLVALIVNALVFVALWSGRGAFGAGRPGGNTPQPA